MENFHYIMYPHRTGLEEEKKKQQKKNFSSLRYIALVLCRH